MLKRITYDGSEVSVVPPSFYAERFVNFMTDLLPEEIVVINPISNRVSVRESKKKDAYANPSARLSYRMTLQ